MIRISTGLSFGVLILSEWYWSAILL